MILRSTDIQGALRRRAQPPRRNSQRGFVINPFSFAGPEPHYLLLHFDGTNNDTTTVDSGPSNLPIARHGSWALKSAQAKFGATSAQMANNMGVGLLSGVPTNLRLASGDFIIDVWVYETARNGGAVLLHTISGSGAHPLRIDLDTGVLRVHAYNSSGIGFAINGATFGTVPLNTWTHVCVSRVGATVYMFMNGTLNNSATAANFYVAAAPRLTLGDTGGYYANMTGFADELRVITGIGVSSSFTPPTAQY